MDPRTGIIIQLVLVLTLAGIYLYFKAVNQYRVWRVGPVQSAAFSATEGMISEAPPAPVAVDSLSLVPGAGKALMHPPVNIAQALLYLKQNYAHRRYSMPLGWQLADDAPDCVFAHLVDDTYHTLITGQTRGGKDNAALNMLFGLAILNDPTQLQICVIDGKGLDFAGWEGKAHSWRLALKPTDIKPAMEALSAERERRRGVLSAAGASKWENYKGTDLPLLVTYVSELTLLEDAVGKNDLTAWLNSELAAGAAFGMRYIIATQTASNFATRWRGQISLYLAGRQVSQSQDQPNTNMQTADLERIGAIPPSALPGGTTGVGVFTAVSDGTAFTIRASLMDDEQRAKILAQLPDAPRQQALPAAQSEMLEKLIRGEPLPFDGNTLERVPGRSEAEKTHSVPFRNPIPAPVVLASTPAPSIPGTERNGTAIEVSDEERAQIVALAKAGISRGKIADQVYGGRSKYDRVKLVLDGLEQAVS